MGKQAKNKKGIVYIATCKINNKKYIGQTTKSLSERIAQHERATRSKTAAFSLFTQAIKEYGIENFIWTIYCECNPEELSVKEMEAIKKFNTVVNGYNLTHGGIGRLGYRHSEETKKKMSKAAQNMSLEHRRKISEALKGRTLSKGTRRKISKSLKGNTNAKGHTVPDELKRKVGDIWRGKEIPENVKEKISQTLKGRTFTEEWRNKIGKSVTINGITYPTHAKAAMALGLTYSAFQHRLRRGCFNNVTREKTANPKWNGRNSRDCSKTTFP